MAFVHIMVILLIPSSYHNLHWQQQCADRMAFGGYFRPFLRSTVSSTIKATNFMSPLGT